MNAASNIVPLPRPEVSFDDFWKSYPKKIAKLAASRAWVKAVAICEPETIIAAVENQKRHLEQWRRDSGQYIPHPATWLNGCRWEDEIEVQIVAASVTRSNNPSRADCIEFAKSCGDTTGFVTSWLVRRGDDFANPENLSWRDLFKTDFEKWKAKNHK